ncbi:MAG: hypothetical protein QXG01_05710 [Candidatus Bathyarchaeia archaeon]
MEKKSEIFLNENSLSPNYLPPKLPYRDQEYNFLKNIFKVDFYWQSALILGGLGFGKTSLSNLVGLELSKESSKLRYIPIPCLECRNSFYQLLLRMIRSFIPNFPPKGHSTSELTEHLIRASKISKSSIIVLVDDLEFLIDKNLRSVYSLARLRESIIDEKIKMYFIYTLGDENFLKELNKEYIGFIKKNIVKLRKYSKEELREILTYRASLAFRRNRVEPEAIELIAQLASKTGNLAYAIETLWRAGKCAEYEKEKKLIAEHVYKIRNKVSPKISNELKKFLTPHEKLLLTAIFESLKKPDISRINIGEVENTYREICEERGEKPRKHTQLWEYMHNLNRFGLISLRFSGKGFRGRSTLINFQPKTIGTIKRLIRI